MMSEFQGVREEIRENKKGGRKAERGEGRVVERREIPRRTKTLSPSLSSSLFVIRSSNDGDGNGDAAVMGEFQGVREEIGEDLINPHSITEHFRVFVVSSRVHV
jgi:hypothetical protein